MSNLSETPAPTPAGGGLWRLLVLDASDPDDARWLIASVTLDSDVRPAVMHNRRYDGWAEVAEWARAQVTGSGRISLVPIASMVWRIDEGDPR